MRCQFCDDTHKGECPKTKNLFTMPPKHKVFPCEAFSPELPRLAEEAKKRGDQFDEDETFLRKTIEENPPEGTLSLYDLLQHLGDVCIDAQGSPYAATLLPQIDFMQKRIRRMPRTGPIGVKHDEGKAPYDLLPWLSVAAVVRVLDFGARKYAPNGWRSVEGAKGRYFAACMRHVLAWWRGEVDDPESGEPHLAHAACCILFLLELEEEKKP